MLSKPVECTSCYLANVGNSFTVPEKCDPNYEYLNLYMIGESAGYEESIDGLPFRPKAQAGSMLMKVLRMIGVSRKMFTLHNLISCQPPNNVLNGAKYEFQVIDHCKHYFDRAVTPISDKEDGKTNVVIGFGNLPLRYMTEFKADEDVTSIGYLNGFPVASPYGIVVPTFHPSYLRRGATEYTKLVGMHIERAIDVAKGLGVDGYTPFTFLHEDLVEALQLRYPSDKVYRPNYIEYPSLDDADSFYYRVKDMESRGILACDIETPMSNELSEDERGMGESGEILQQQFSLAKGEAIVFPNLQEYNEIAKKIYATAIVKAAHNGYDFDYPRIKAAGYTIGGKQIDTMWMFHRWEGDLDMNLQFVASYCGFPFPWKHMFGSKISFYGCADVDSLHWILADIPNRMKGLRGGMHNLSVWDGYRDGVLAWKDKYDGMSAIGIPIDGERRKEVGEWLDGEIVSCNKKLQEMYPDELRNIEPKVKLKDKIGESKEKIELTEEVGLVDLVEVKPKRGRKKMEEMPASMAMITTNANADEIDLW